MTIYSISIFFKYLLVARFHRRTRQILHDSKFSSICEQRHQSPKGAEQSPKGTEQTTCYTEK